MALIVPLLFVYDTTGDGSFTHYTNCIKEKVIKKEHTKEEQICYYAMTRLSHDRYRISDWSEEIYHDFDNHLYTYWVNVNPTAMDILKYRITASRAIFEYIREHAEEQINYHKMMISDQHKFIEKSGEILLPVKKKQQSDGTVVTANF